MLFKVSRQRLFVASPFSSEAPMELRNLKIIAIEGATISNSFLGSN